MGKEYKIAGNFERIQIEIRLMMPIGTDDLSQWSDDIAAAAIVALSTMPWPDGKLGKLTKLSETNFYQDFPNRTRDFRIQFYADILKTDE